MPANQGVHYFAQIPGQQMTTRFRSGGVRIESGGTSPWFATMAIADCGDSIPNLVDGRVEYNHSNGIKEWYENRPEGLEHAFSVSRKPDGRDDLRVTVSLDGVSAAPDDRAGAKVVTFIDLQTGTPVLDYGEPKAWDASGRELAVHYEARGQAFDIVVADRGATYPVTVDPLISSREARVEMAGSGDGAAGDRLGHAVAMSADTVLAGAPDDDTAWGNSTGSVYVFVLNGGTWSLQSKLVAEDANFPIGFGNAVALSGDLAAVGAYLDDSPTNSNTGSVYVFSRSGGAWIQQAKLRAEDSAFDDQFGTAVALDGDTLVVGSAGDDPGENFNAGSAYVFTAADAVWTQQAKLTATDVTTRAKFGSAVALSEDTALIGALGDYTAGSCYVFTRDGNVWSQQEKLMADVPSQLDKFGCSVALSGETALVGAFFAETTAGASGSAYVFIRDGSTWSKEAQLLGDDSAENDYFGWSVALEGDTALVSASRHDPAATFDAGSAYVFVRHGQVWSQESKLAASNGSAADQFGQSVALSGETALVGTSLAATAAGEEAGSAYLFKRVASRWSQEFQFTGGDGHTGSRFGHAVAISGNVALIGAYGDDTAAGNNSGSAHFFSRKGSAWIHQSTLVPDDAVRDDQFGWSVAIDRNQAIVGAPWSDTSAGVNAGSAYVLARTGKAWMQQVKLTAASAAARDQFGFSVAISKDIAAAGANLDDTAAGADSGSTGIFARKGRTWIQQATVSGDRGSRFGTSLALSKGTILVGAPNAAVSPTNANAGHVVAYVRSGTAWNLQAVLTAGAHASPGDRFGESLAMSGESALIGVPGDDHNGYFDIGSAYLFSRQNGNWNERTRFLIDEAQGGNRYGLSVALSGKTALVGSELSGVAVFLQQGGDSWSRQSDLDTGESADPAGFGRSVAVSGFAAIAGAPADSPDDPATGEPRPGRGSAHFFRLRKNRR